MKLSQILESKRSKPTLGNNVRTRADINGIDDEETIEIEHVAKQIFGAVKTTQINTRKTGIAYVSLRLHEVPTGDQIEKFIQWLNTAGYKPSTYKLIPDLQFYSLGVQIHKYVGISPPSEKKPFEPPIRWT